MGASTAEVTPDAGAEAAADATAGPAGPAGTRRPASMAWSTSNCSVGRTLDVVGEKWAFQVLREVFLGVRRFEDMHLHAGIPRQVLSKRLASLVEAGLLDRVPYREEGARERHEYRLTEAGAELRTAMVALIAWGDRYLADPEGPALLPVHRGCGEPVRARRALRRRAPRRRPRRPGLRPRSRRPPVRAGLGTSDLG